MKLFRYTDRIYTTIPVEEYKLLLSQEEQCRKEHPSEFRGYQSNRFCWNENTIERHDTLLVEIVEELGSDVASANFAKLKVVEIPDDIEYVIMENDGYEWISEKHQTWGYSDGSDSSNESEDSENEIIADR